MGREAYTFTEDDVFLDNEACVQCLSVEVSRPSRFGSFPVAPLVMTKKSLKLLDEKCERVIVTTHNYSNIEGLTVFSLKLKGE